MSGAKSLNVYSLDEAAIHFNAALALLNRSPNCASDDQVAEFLVPYTLFEHEPQTERRRSMYSSAICRALTAWAMIQEQFSSDINMYTHFCSTRVIEKERPCRREASAIASRLGDSRSKAYSLAGEIFVSTVVAPKPLDEFEALKREAIEAASDTADAYIQNLGQVWHRLGRVHCADVMNDARDFGSRTYANWSAV